MRVGYEIADFMDAHLLALGSGLRSKSIWRLTWISHDGRTKKELDHIPHELPGHDQIIQRQLWCGRNLQQLGDHRLVVAVILSAFVLRADLRKNSKFNVS